MPKNNKIYFASDFHLGVPNYKASREREALLISWLNYIEKDASEIYLLGDVFDFWFEYKTVVPKGYVRLLGKLAELCDRGIVINMFTGNHDMWMFEYLEDEVGVNIIREPIVRTYNGKRFYIGHGDGLGPGDYSYKLLKKVFANKVCQWLFARFHPNFSFGIAQYWSRRSRLSNSIEEEAYTTKEKEWLYQYALAHLQKEPIDYFIFGHRHLPLSVDIEGSMSKYINLGEWFSGNPHYAVMDDSFLNLLPYVKGK